MCLYHTYAHTHTHTRTHMYIHTVHVIIAEGSLEVKLPTVWTDGKAQVGRAREEKRRREKIREEKESEERRSKHRVFPMICGSGGSKSRLANKPKCTTHTHTPCTDHFWKLRCQKSARRCGAKHMSKSKVQKTKGYGAFLNVQMSFHVAGAGDCAPCQK